MAKKKCSKCNSMITVAKGVKVRRGKEESMRKKQGSSNAGSYPDVKPSDFVGAAGGASKYSYPINTRSRARAAIAYSGNAPDPAGIKEAVYKRYPDLRPKSKKKSKNKK